MARQVPLSGMARIWERQHREAAAALAAQAAAAIAARQAVPVVVEVTKPARPKRVRAVRQPRATSPEKPGVLSTAGGDQSALGMPIAEQDQGVKAVIITPTVLQKPTQNMTENITGPVRSSEGKRGSRKPASSLTQHGATTPGSRSGGGKAPAGNVAKSQLGPTGHRVEHPSDVPTDPMLISEPTIVAPEINTPAAGDWPISALREGQCRFACTGHYVPADQHRFCGQPTTIGPGNLYGSWCPEHLERMYDRSSRLARPSFLKRAGDCR